MTARRADVLAVAAISLAAIVVTWPLLASPLGLPPKDWHLDFDLLDHYGFAAAAHTTVFRFQQFPLRSPWHGGGYPLYAYPEDKTLSPTMLLILAAGPWAGLKIEFVLLTIAGGIGMFLLTRRMMGYSVAAALFSATVFAFGGFLMARWLRGFIATTHGMWLPWIMYALWRGRERRRWLAVAAVLVAWMLIGHKYLAVAMGWFLLMVGLLRLYEPQRATGEPRSARGYFGRLTGVWLFGVGLAAVKLIPMAPLVSAHLTHERAGPPFHEVREAVALWLVIFAALGLVPALGRAVRRRRTRAVGIGAVVAVAAAVILAATVWAPPGRLHPLRRAQYLRMVVDSATCFGSWRTDARGERAPIASDGYYGCAPVGPLVCVLAAAAVFLRPRTTWKWAILLALFIVFELSPLLPRNLAESWRRLPLLSLVNRSREQLNFYLMFILALLAGRALDWRGPLRRIRLLRVVAWGLLAVNVAYLGWNTHVRLASSVSGPVPPPSEWGDYQLFDDPGLYRKGFNLPCFLLRGNTAVAFWGIELRDRRHVSLVPTRVRTADGTSVPNPAFRGMAVFDSPENGAELVTFTPNRIVARVTVRRPGVLVINQIADPDWRVSDGTLVRGVPLLAVRLSRLGEYEVRLRYVPALLYYGLIMTVATAIVGCVLLVMTTPRFAPGPVRQPSSEADG